MFARCGVLLWLSVAPALALPLTYSGAAAAQEDEATLEMARQRFQEGVNFYDKGQFDKARAAFLQAYALRKHPAVLLNLAQSELRAGKEAEAAKHFTQYLRENTAASPAEKSEAEKGLSAAKEKVHELSLRAEEGAEVFVDGASVGKAPLPDPVFLLPGSHALEARKGDKTATSEVTAAAGQSSTETLAFDMGGPGATPVAPAGPQDGGGPGPNTTGPTDTGVTDAGPGREPFMDWALRSPVAWVGAGLVGVGVIGGTGFAIGASSSYSQADDYRAAILQKKEEREAMGTEVGAPCAAGSPDEAFFAEACQTWEDEVDSADTKKAVSTVFFLAGIGLGAATIVGGYFLTAEKQGGASSAQRRGPRRASATLAPVVGPELQGLVLSGAF